MTDAEDDRIWHAGERLMQTRAGTRARMADIGPRFIRSYMPDQHRQFFAQLPMMVVGAEDSDGNLWAGAWFGPAGFIISPDPTHLLFQHPGASSLDDPTRTHLAPGTRLGMLGIDLATRRRNRVNGFVAEMDEQQLLFQVTQSFGNCPQYIVQRQPVINPNHGAMEPIPLTTLDADALALIHNVDTFFITTGFNDGVDAANRGIDVSHRGGAPGFIQVDAAQHLWVPDYPGNGFFTTLGNLLLDDRAGLWIPDFRHGHALYLTTRAQVFWRSEMPERCGDAEHVLRFTVQSGYRIPNALPLLWETLPPA